MAIIQTYVCDASGVVGNKEDFYEVRINAQKVVGGSSYNCVAFTKLIHKDVAVKLHLAPQIKDEAQPEPTLESKLLVLLKEYITDIAYEAGSEGAAEAVRHSGGM